MKRKKILTLHKGEFYSVYKGVEHKIIPQGHVKLMLFEPVGIKHTGADTSEVTKEKLDWLDL